MPYYTYCIKCNQDGSYSQVDRKCSKCSGTGNDWRRDEELDGYHKWANICLSDLKTKKEITVQNTTFIYENTIPSLEEERSRINYKKQNVDKQIQENRADNKDNIKQLSFFTINFYDESLKQLNYYADYSGAFNTYTLLISLLNVDMNKITNIMPLIKNSLNEQDESLNKNSLDKNQELHNLIKFIEVYSHEFFHLVEFLTCKSMLTLYKVSRKIMTIRAYVFSEAINSSIKYQRCSGENIFSAINKLKDKDIQYKIFEMIKNARLDVLSRNNYFQYKSEKSNLCINDLAEGSAYFFQKIANKTLKIPTLKNLNIGTKSPYLKAWDYYYSEGGRDEVIFFLMAYQSLKYGILDDGDFMGSVPTPMQYFEFLCENYNKYLHLFDNVVAGKPSSNPFLAAKPLGFKSLIIDEMEKIGNHSQDVETGNDINILEDLGIDNDKITIIEHLTDMLSEMKQDIKEYSQKHNIYHEDDFFEFKFSINEDNLLFKPLFLVNKQIKQNNKIFSSKYFIPTLITDNNFYTKFLAKVIEIVNNISFTGFFGQPSNIFIDSNIYKIVEDFDMMLKGKFYCCDEHQYINFFEIEECRSSDCFSSRFFRIFNKTTEDCIT